ncbi:hypothetical protein EVAR_98576_1 [Eumeta japonica]|uniref:Uncharacterized protein n=1 Tax=Eumeta variegata TaxID=151549 RepID=A0A4C1YR77_EUMVA|nr:hypothetical protein EVAR_98576_1 [Eumeta japonica]
MTVSIPNHIRSWSGWLLTTDRLRLQMFDSPYGTNLANGYRLKKEAWPPNEPTRRFKANRSERAPRTRRPDVDRRAFRHKPQFTVDGHEFEMFRVETHVRTPYTHTIHTHGDRSENGRNTSIFENRTGNNTNFQNFPKKNEIFTQSRTFALIDARPSSLKRNDDLTILKIVNQNEDVHHRIARSSRSCGVDAETEAATAVEKVKVDGASLKGRTQRWSSFDARSFSMESAQRSINDIDPDTGENPSARHGNYIGIGRKASRARPATTAPRLN